MCIAAAAAARCSAIASSDGIIVTLGSVDYTYDFTYGLGSCGAWDELKPPYCNEGETPEWCFDEWCFVDGDSCTGVPIADSSYFPGLKYSYQTWRLQHF